MDAKTMRDVANGASWFLGPIAGVHSDVSAPMPDSTAIPLASREDDITGLVQRRAMLRSEITRGRRDLQILADEFQRLDAAIRDLKGSAAAGGAQPRPAGPSDVTRILFESLDAAEAPMTSRVLALRVMEELGLDAADKAVTKHTVRRVCVCLWEQVQRGHFRKAEPKTWPLTWERVRTAQ